MSPMAMAKRVKELGQSSLALTDHGNLFGLVKFHDACKKVGVKPILGLEAYLCLGSLTTKESVDGKPPPLFHLILLAMSQEGLTNLYKLATIAHTEGFYYKPRIDFPTLAKHSQGLICTNACIKGIIPTLVLANEMDTALEHLKFLQHTFGDRFYLEIQRQGHAEQEQIIPPMLQLARDTGTKVIATCDSHYLTKEDSKFQEQLVMINTGGAVDKTDSFKFATDQLYLKSENEMLALFSGMTEVVHNTQEIAERCQAGLLDKYNYIFPKVSENDDKVFTELAMDGLVRIGKQGDKAYAQRLDYEIDTIRKMGFQSYFLVVAEYIQWARANGIMVGPGRGSAAGSLVAYCLGITEIDPLKYDLLFERFLNPGRKSMPDIDSDFCQDRRTEVVAHLKEKYPGRRVAQIVTFGEFKPRSAIRDFARVQGRPYETGDKAAKLVPPPIRGHDPTWEKTLKECPELSRGEYGQITAMARKSEGLVRQSGIHAAGVIIADKPLTEYSPLFLGKDNELLTQWDMEDLERIGLVKMDLLGITELTVIDNCLKTILQTTGRQIDISKIPENDEDAFAVLAKGDTTGIFQFDTGGGIRELAIKLKPSSIDEIAAINALYRPGPLDSGLLETYAKRKIGMESVEYLIPQLEPILRPTLGALIFQEQAMKIATDLAGYSLPEADDLRKAIGKKIPEKMAEQEKKLIAGMLKNGIKDQHAEAIFEEIKHHADYSFNKSHAVAYSMTTYRTCWLKAHYPVEFYCALLTQHMGERDKIVEYMAHCKQIDIQVLPPDVNESDVVFTVAKSIIRFGLAGIKGVGTVARRIVEERKKKPFKDLVDFYTRTKDTGANKRTIEALIKAGAMTSLGHSRSSALAAIEELVEFPKKMKAYEAKLVTYQKKLIKHNDREQERQLALDLGSSKIKPSLALPEPPPEPQLPTVPELPEMEIDEILKLERETLGFYVSSHPLYDFQKEILTKTTAHTSSLGDCASGERVTLLAVLTGLKIIPTKRGTKIAQLDIEDLHGHTEGIMFSKQLAQYQEHLVEGSVILIKGRVEIEDSSTRLIIDSVTPQIKKKLPIRVRIVIAQNQVTLSELNTIETILALPPGEIEAEVLVELHGKYFRLEKVNRLSQTSLDALRDIKALQIVAEQKENNGR